MKNIFQKKSLILSVIFFIFSFFIFYFLYNTINNNKEDLFLAQEKWQTEYLRRENIKSLVNLLKIIESEKTLLETHFVKNSDIVIFLDTIEKLAKDVGAKAEIANVNKDNSSLSIEMKVEGDFETIYKLILLLENSPYNMEFIFVNIQNLNGVDLSITKNPQWIATFKIKLLNFINL